MFYTKRNIYFDFMCMGFHQGEFILNLTELSDVYVEEMFIALMLSVDSYHSSHVNLNVVPILDL